MRTYYLIMQVSSQATFRIFSSTRYIKVTTRLVNNFGSLLKAPSAKLSTPAVLLAPAPASETFLCSALRVLVFLLSPLYKTSCPLHHKASQSLGEHLIVSTLSCIHTHDHLCRRFRDQRAFRFLGIPYANPPARWTYPSAYTGSQNIDATAFGSPCVQTGTSGTSESCLFLNIFTPFVPASASSPKTSLKPVMFWIHGGAFTSGTGADPTFEGGPMVSRGDVILVTINYRLSTLGFLALNDGETNGNYGIADIIAALEWVNEHISAFGGDPDRITIFGQSAGAGAVRGLLQSPRAIGKFAAAIQMSNLAGSNYATTYSNYYTIEEEVAVAADPILQATNCTTTSSASALECLKQVDPNTLVNLATVARCVVVFAPVCLSNENQNQIHGGRWNFHNPPILASEWIC